MDKVPLNILISVLNTTSSLRLSLYEWYFTPLTVFVALHCTHSRKFIFLYKVPHTRCGLTCVDRGELSTPSTCWQLCSKHSPRCTWPSLLQRHIAGELFAHQAIQVLLCQHSCLPLKAGACGCSSPAEFPEVPLCLLLQLVKVPLDGSTPK